MKIGNSKLNRKSSRVEEKPVSKGRHEYHCTICSHPKREDIEQAFVNWGNTTKLAAQYSISRDAVYRHAHALGLMDKRRRNVRAALEKIIEKAGEVEVNAPLWSVQSARLLESIAKVSGSSELRPSA